MTVDGSAAKPSAIEYVDEKNERSRLILNESTSSTADVRRDRRPRRTFCQLLRHGSQQFALEFAFSCETALGTPILLELGIPAVLQGLCWVLGPILGFALGPLVGSLSDNCTSRWGRRRPFLLVLNLLVIVGSAGYLNVQYIQNDGLSMAVALVGILLVDLCAFLTESASRAYLLDVCDIDDVSQGLLMRTVLGGLGCGIAYVIVGVDWVNTPIASVINSNYEVVFLFTVLVYLVCMTLSMTSIAEEPLPLERDDEKESEVAMKTIKRYTTEADTEGQGSPSSSDEEDAAPTLRERISSIFGMPTCMRWLCLTHFFGWASFTAIVLYFTDYFAQEVLHGIPTAPINSTAFQAYQQGTRYGSWGLCIFGFSTAVLSLLFLKIQSCFSTKVLYIGPPLIFGLCVGSMAFLVDYPTPTLILCSSFSLIFVTITTIPYDILAKYHDDETFTHPPNGPVRGQGTDMGILFAMTFLGQIVVSILIGPLVEVTQSQLPVVILTSVMAFLSVISAFFVTY
nr:proton-associated sugar transporter A-like [Lytechinus pictus]